MEAYFKERPGEILARTTEIMGKLGKPMCTNT